MSSTRYFALLTLPAVFLLSACARKEPGPYEMVKYNTRVLATSRSGPELEGHKLFAQKCSICHIGNAGEVPFGGWLNRDRLTVVGKNVARDRIMNGSPRMPAWKHTLSSGQVDQLLAYIQTVTTTKTVIPPPQRRKDMSER